MMPEPLAGDPSALNAVPSTFHHVIERLESGNISLDPWLTHAIDLEDLPVGFDDLVKRPDLVKAVVHV